MLTCSKVCFGPAKGCIQLTNHNAIFLARIYQFPILTPSIIILLLIGMSTNQQICWTNELDQHQRKIVIYIGLNQVKILQFNLLFHCNQVAYCIQASKKDLFYFYICITRYKHMFVHSAVQTHGTMLELKSRRKENYSIFKFS